MELNEIFSIEKYQEAYQLAEKRNLAIIEIKPSEKGDKQYQLIEIPLTKNEILQNEICDIKYWFNTYYTEHEQKYRRLNTLKQLTDELEDPYNKLVELYQEAEIKRKRIQEIEVLLQC